MVKFSDTSVVKQYRETRDSGIMNRRRSSKTVRPSTLNRSINPIRKG